MAVQLFPNSTSLNLVIRPYKEVPNCSLQKDFQAEIFMQGGTRYYLPQNATFVLENYPYVLKRKFYFVKVKYFYYLQKQWFYVKKITADIPLNFKKNMLKTLNSFPLIKEYNLVTSFFEKYHYASLRELEYNAISLKILHNIPKYQISAFQIEVQKLMSLLRLRLFLNEHKIDPNIASQINCNIHKLPHKSIKDIIEVPYYLAKYGVSFHKIDNIAYQENISHLSPLRYNAAIVQFLENKFSQGYFSISLNDFYYQIKDWFLTNNGFKIKEAKYFNRRIFNGVLDDLVLFKRIYLVSKNTGKVLTSDALHGNKKSEVLIYLNTMFEVETNVLAKIQKRILAAKRQVDKDKFKFLIKNFEDKNNIKLSPEQQSAIFDALQNKIYAITGKAGTGKSLLIAAFVYIYSRIFSESKIQNYYDQNNIFYKQILCVSPTGRAAQNLAQNANFSVYTIHKAFNILPEQASKEKFFIGDCLVIDEASMLDTGLWSNILDHVSEQTQILLVGDPNQLLPINAGSLFADILKSGRVPYSKLNHCYRAESSDLLNLSDYILGKKSTFSFQDKANISFLETQSDEETLDKYLDVTKKLSKENKDYLALCVKNVNKLGTKSLNALIRASINPVGKKKSVKIGDNIFCLQDKVFQVKNNYSKEQPIMNGEFGKIVGFKNLNSALHKTHHKYSRGLKIDFNGKIVDYTFAKDLESISLGYAINIFKAQGSEAPTVVFPIAFCDKNMLNRSLIYTAVTRAKKNVILIGSKQLFEDSIKKTSSDQNIGLTVRLRQTC